MTPAVRGTAAAGLGGPGTPLEPGVRDQLSTSFGHDFSPVRVHVGPEADRAGRELGAVAYTVGNDIAFTHGAYDPLSHRGRALIAHELAHVAQHGGRTHAPSFLRSHPTAAVPTADTRLEHQAHTASALHAHGAPLPPGWTWERPPSPFLGRADLSWTQLKPAEQYSVEYAGTRTIRQEQRSPDDPEGALRVNMGVFAVPASKGPWEKAYQAVAEAKGLQAVVKMSGKRPSAGLWEKRAPTEELRRLWLLRMEWPRNQAVAWWQQAGGDPPKGGDFNPHVKTKQSQIDHIVELQLGGTNVPENLAPHDDTANMESGRKIAQDVQQAAASVADALEAKGRKRPTQVILWFGGAEQKPKYGGAVDALPPPLTGRKAQTALQVHFTAEADRKEGRRPNAKDKKDATDAWAAYRPYPLAAGPSRQSLRVPEKPEADDGDAIEESQVPENRAARELIAGITLEKLHRPSSGKGKHTVTAWIASKDHPARSGTRLPIEISKNEQKLTFDVRDPFEVGSLSLRGGKDNVHFLYPYLSKGHLTLTSTEQGLAGHGTLNPSVPLLSKVPITVDWDDKGFRGSVQAPADKLSLPRPLKVTDAALTVSLAPQFEAGGHVAFALGSVAEGRIDAGVDAQGLFAKGRLVGHIPGLDEATGELEYRPANGLTGFVVARASRPSGPIRSGEVRLDLGDGKWQVGGQLDLMLPGDSPAQLTVRKADDRVVYAGKSTLKVPGLKPVDVAVRYDGRLVEGSARTTFTLLGADGEIALRYLDGKFSGDGSVVLRRGRFEGRLDAHLDGDGHISGRGTGVLTIRPGLVATVGIEYGKDRKLRVLGELRFPPYRFLEPRGGHYELFRRSLPDIPIFAIPLGIGSIGLVARIGGSLAVFYRFGPGEIRDMVIRGAFNPLEEHANAELAAEARLVLPAEAGLELSVRAGLGASVAIASATGGITVTGGVLLRGGLDAVARLAYAAGVLSFDTTARISVQPVLTLRIDADILIEAALGGPWRFPYELASYSYATGLEFGLVAPFHYRSDQPIRLPEARDIQWIVPQIDVMALATRVAGKVRGGLGF